MINYFRRLFRTTIRHYLLGDEIVEERLADLQEEIHNAIQTKQVLIEGLEDTEENEDRRRTIELLKDEQRRNNHFLEKLTHAIVYLNLNSQSKRDTLVIPVQELLEQQADEDDDDDDDDSD